MAFIKKHILLFIGILIGAVAGYAYWHFIGCEESCSIRSSWYRSTLYGSVLGGLLVSVSEEIYSNYFRNPDPKNTSMEQD